MGWNCTRYTYITYTTIFKMLSYNFNFFFYYRFKFVDNIIYYFNGKWRSNWCTQSINDIFSFYNISNSKNVTIIKIAPIFHFPPPIFFTEHFATVVLWTGHFLIFLVTFKRCTKYKIVLLKKKGNKSDFVKMHYCILIKLLVCDRIN